MSFIDDSIKRLRAEEEERRKREQAAQLIRGSQSSSNSNSSNSSTNLQNSSQTSQGGSQSPSAVDKLFHSTARKYSNATANDPTRRNSRGQEVSSRARTRSAVNSPKTTGPKLKEDTGEWAKNEAYGALTGFNKELASAADFLLPDVITPKKVQNVLDYYRNADEEQQQKVQASRGDSKLREIAGTIGGETLKNIPAAAMAMLSGGTSVGAQVAGKAVPSLLEGAQIARTGNIVQRAMSEVARTSGQNPMFWETFMRTVGPTYDNEIQNGADPVRATLSAYANALLNAQIEIGGGVEVYDPSEVFWKAALRSAKEEGLEEVQQYAVENLTNKAIGSNTAKWFSMNRGEDAVINPIDMAEQGFYGAAAGGLMSGGRTLGVNAVNSIRNDNYRNANPDLEERANELIQRASLQGREGEMATRAQNLAEEVSDQMARGKAPTAYQMRELERAVATDEYYNDKAYQESSQERYNQAVNEGRANTVESTGTADEYYGFQRGLTETEQRNYERAKAVMGEDASERSVVAVGRFMTGSESNSDIDTILLDPKAKSAVEELTDVTLPINNTKARTELENLALAHNIANNDRILEETHNDIRTNMSRRGGEFFDKNYDEAVATIDEPNAADIYESFFSRFYTAGTVEGADFEKTYNRIISPLVEDFGEELGTKISQVFNHDFAQKVFAEGQIAMNSVRAKAQGKRLSVKASENPAGFTYEAEARKHISDKEAELFTKLAERAKVHIRLVSSIAGGKANGSYDPETGVILIAADSDNKFITVFKHELTHHLKNTSPEMYQKLEDFVFKRWYDGDPEKMEARVQEYQKRYGFRPDEAREEIIADASEAFFTDQGAINDAVTFNEKMARAIHDGIKSLLDTFLDLVDTDRRADKGYGDFLGDLDILRDAEKMWLEALNESVGRRNGSAEGGTFIDSSTGENVQFSLRTEAPPKKTRKGYKVFVVKNGELYPPMVANPNGEPTPVGVWLNADEGVRAGTSKTGRPQVKAGGKGTQGGSGTLAYRPGWHLGEMPLAQQFARKDSQGNKTLFPNNFVWAECDIAADNDYQEEAMSYGYTENGKFRHAYAGLPRIPKDGFYQYRTNPDPNTVPWLITGAMKINRILSDAEVRDILAEKGIEAPKRQGGDKTLEELGIKKVKFSLKDSDGNTLSKGQQEYFKDSKARDENGNLLVLYHGTENAGFTIFDSEAGISSPAFFFTNNLEIAKGYSGTHDIARMPSFKSVEAVQKAIKNDMDADIEIRKEDGKYVMYEDGDYVDESRNLNDLYNLYNQYSGFGGTSSNYKVYLNVTNPLIVDAKGKSWDDITTDFSDEPMTSNAIAEYAKENGYDGVVIRNVVDAGLYNSSGEYKTGTDVIAFNPEQIKDIDNKNPTKDPDIRYSIKDAPSMDKLDKSGAVLTKNNGDPIAKFEENGSVQFSIKTYDDNGRRIYKEYLDKMVKNRQLTKAEAKQMQDELETIYKITKSFADSGKYAPFTAWSNAEVVTGENGKPVFSAIKKNSEYKMNIDFSTICKKRRTLDNVFRVMVNRGLFEQLDLNKDESAALVVNINDLIRKHGFEAACALCFVEARRYRQQQTATTFRDMWNDLVESMYKDKSKIEYFNYGENIEKKPVPDGIHTMSDKDLNLTRLKKLANAKNDEGKPLQTAEAKAARLLLRDPSQRKLMLVGDMMASTGFENMQVKNPELMKIYNAKKGTGGAKSSFGDVQYLNEILKPRSFGRMSAYAVSGVRIQSFSDYVPRMVFDYVQVIADLSAKRLPAHAYTKEVLFALQFGLTGAKINMSLVPDVVADGVAPGLDKNGDYVWNKEGTFPWEDYTDKNGRKMPGARTIQKAKEYKENCGTIAVGISDQQIWKMLLDPEIQMVIPYHKSSLNPLVAAMTNVDRFTDYTEYQNTRDKNGKAVEKEFDWDRKLFRLSHDSNNKLLPRSEWGDVQALVKEYVDWCNKHEYTPKFSQFLYMKDGSINPGYYKMLEDFALLDNDGTFKPQDDVKMSFPTDESAFGSMASLIEQGLDEDTKLEAKRSSEINGIVDEIEDMIKDGSITKQTISSQALADKMEDKFKYSLKSNGESRSYQSTITKLENQVKDLKSEFKRTNLKTADQRNVRIQAGKLITRHGSNMQAQKSLIDTFNEIFKLYKEKGTDAFDEVYEIAKNEAVNIVNNISIVHNEGEETYKAIKDYLRNTPITISEDMKRNITDFNDFRKRYFGKLKITNGNTTNIDTVYMELMELFPEQFTEDYINPADQLYHMADVLDNYAPYYETLDGASEEMQDYVVDIASDIMETAYGLQTKKTFADKKYEEKVRAVEKARQKALESRDKELGRLRRKYDEVREALWKANEKTAAERLRGEMDTQRAKQRLQDYKAETKERGEKKRRIQQIANIHKRLSDMPFKGNDTKHLPDGYADTVARVLSLFDFTTKGMERWAERNGKLSNRYQALKDLNDKLEQIGELEKNGIPSSIEFDERLVGGVRYLYNAFSDDLKNSNDRRLEDMTSEELTHIKRLFEAFEFQIKMENKTFDEENKRTRSEMAHSIFDDLNETKRGKWRLGVMGRLFTSNFNPSDFFTLVGGDIETLYNSTRKGFDKYVERLSNAKDFIQDNVSNKKADKWANHVKTYKTSSGEEIELTDSMLMSLYCLSKREQAQGHIYGGGIASAPARVKNKMTTRELEKKRVIPSYQDLQRWFSDLTDEQIQVAEQIQKYFVDEVSEWGNETSLKLFNYRKFNEPNYFPIQSSKDYMASNFDERGTDPVLKNIGPSHQTVEGANNVIMVDDIFTVFSKHVAQMAAYNAYVPAITDFQRVWNYTEGNDQDMVKARFADVYGQKTADYIENFFKNLNGVYKRNFDVGLFDKGLGLFKKSAVGGNIRVLVQQPTAIARAALIINPVYLTAALPTTTAHPKRTFKEMMDHCSIAKWKTWGFYSSDITSASRDLRNIMIGKEALTDKVFMDMYGVADNMTWTVIFKACELQVEAQNKGIKKGSDEYWEKVSALATRVFDRTQVVDSPFHRSEVMKSQDKGIKMVTAFMAEPTKTINMLNTELTMAARELANGHPARATGVFVRVATVITANSALLAVAQALVDAARGAGGDDDKDKGNYVERLINYWKENFWDNMNPFAMIPYIKDVKSLWDGYDVARMDMNGVKKVIQAIQYLQKYYEDPANSKYTEAEEWKNLALTACYAAGVPIQNAKRDLEAIYLTAMEAAGHSEVFFEQAKRKYQVNDKTRAMFADMYYDALDRKDYRTADKIYSFLLRNGITEKYIDGREKTWRKHKDENDEG